MMYPFMTLDDGTEIVHSETLEDGRVKDTWRNRMRRTASITLPAICLDMSGKTSMDFLIRILKNIRKSLNLMRVIEARSGDVIDKWVGYFGQITYYC